MMRSHTYNSSISDQVDGSSERVRRAVHVHTAVSRVPFVVDVVPSVCCEFIKRNVMLQLGTTRTSAIKLGFSRLFHSRI